MKAQNRSGLTYLSAFISLYILLFVIAVLLAFVRQPFGDMFDWLALDFLAQDSADPGFFLWTPHNGHHLVWTRLLTAIDVRLLHGQSWPFVVAAAACLLAPFLLLRSAIKTGIATNPFAKSLALVIPLALLVSVNSIDVAIHVNCQYTFVIFFVIAAICICERDPLTYRDQLAVILLLVGAFFGSNIGLALVPVILISVWRRQGGRQRPFAFSATVLIIALFMILSGGVMAISSTSDGELLYIDMVRRMLYFLNFCGLPWSASSPRHLPFPGMVSLMSQAVGPLVGALMVGLSLNALRQRTVQTSDSAKLERVAHSLILFVLTVAAMAAIGRANVLEELSIPVRYALLVAPLHIGLLICFALRTNMFNAGHRVNSKYLLILGALLIVQQLAGVAIIFKYSRHLDSSLAEFAAGDRSPDVMKFVYPALGRASFLNAIEMKIKKRALYQ